MKLSEELPFYRLGSYWYTPQHPFFVPVVSGAEGDETDEEREAREAEEAKNRGNKTGNEKVDLTQEDVNRIMIREKKEGKTAGRKELMKKLGVESEEELEALVTSHRAATEKEKTEAQKEKDAATKERSEAEAEKKAAKQERFEAKCERALLAAECPAKIIEKAARLLDIKADDDPDKDDIDAAVEALKKEMPQLFAEASEGGNTHSDTGANGSRQSKGKKSSAEQASEELARRHPELAKKT